MDSEALYGSTLRHKGVVRGRLQDIYQKVYLVAEIGDVWRNSRPVNYQAYHYKYGSAVFMENLLN